MVKVKDMRRSIGRFLMRFKYVITLVVFAVLIGFVGENSLVNRFEKKSEIAALKGEIDEYNREFEHDREALNRLKNDPEAIKEVARERYHMKAEDEDLYVIEDE